MATLEYLQSAESSSDLAEYTFSSQNLGAADAGRYIIVAIGSRKVGASANVTSVTVAGVSATIVVNNPATVTNTGYVGIAVALVPTGTTGDVVVTFSGTMVRASIALYRATGINPVASDTLEVDGSSLTGNIDVTDGGITVGVATNSANNAFTWTGLTEDADQNTTGESTYRFTAASAVEGTTTTKTVTASATGMSSEAVLGVAHFEVAYRSWGGTSDTDPGFANVDTPLDTDPFNSGDKVSYTVQNDLPEGTYQWRVRAKDPSGSGKWGEWSETREFIVSLGPSFNPAIARRRLLL